MEIALAADIAVAQGLVVGGLVKESAIEAILEDRTDRGDGASLDEDAASAGRIDARVVVAPGQRQDAEAGAKALLGMPGTDSIELGEFCKKLPSSVGCDGAKTRLHIVQNGCGN